MVERKFKVDTCFLRLSYISGMKNEKIRADIFRVYQTLVCSQA